MFLSQVLDIDGTTNIPELIIMEQKLRMHDKGEEVHQTLLNLDEMHKQIEVKEMMHGPVRNWNAEIRDAEGEYEELMITYVNAVMNFIKEMPMQNTHEMLSAAKWVPYFFDFAATNQHRMAIPLDPKITARYGRIAQLLFYYNRDAEMIKKIGMELHLFGGIDMQRAAFYTFSHMFPKLKNDRSGEDMVSEIRSIMKTEIEENWDGIGEWKY